MVISVDSRIARVTVYATGARVGRVATVPAGQTRVRIAGLPLAVIDDTVRAELDSGVVRAIRVAIDAPATDATVAEDSAELRAARRRAALATAEHARLAAAIEQASEAAVVAEPPDDAPPAAWADVLAARRGVVAARTARERALREALVVAGREATEAAEALAVAEDRERRAGSARAPRVHELRKAVELEVTGDGTLRLEYQIAAARWAPTYVARLDGDAVHFELRAVIAQDSGEDWTSVALALSTAAPHRFSALPELAAQRIGRRQDAPARTGFRAAPIGAGALYADYARAFPPPPPPRPHATPRDESVSTQRPDTFAEEVWDDGSSNEKDAFQTPPVGVAPAMARPKLAPQEFKKMASLDVGRGGAAAPSANRVPAPPPPPVPQPRLDYGALRMAPARSPQRGTLVAETADPALQIVAAELATRDACLADLALPPGCVVGWAQGYDYAFAAEGALDVRADGAWTSVPLLAKAGTVRVHHVAVPREQADVFRVAAIANPFDGPLLPGPIDVYDRGQFVLTSAVELTAPGGSVDVGLGVDPSVKLARNTEFREEVGGMLRGALRLHHAIAIEIDNRSPRAIDLEVRERVPVVREGADDVELSVGKVEPAWERWTPDAEAPDAARLRGGYRWRLNLPANTKRALKASYEIKIASKHELVGGNRRES